MRGLTRILAVALAGSFGTLVLGAQSGGAVTSLRGVAAGDGVAPSFGSYSSSDCSTDCIYVAAGNDTTDGFVTVINAGTHKVITTIKLPGVDFGPLDAYYVAATKTIWVSTLIPGDIYVISTATNKIVKTLALSADNSYNPGFMALAPGGKMFVSDYDHGGYFSVNVNTYAVSSFIKGCGGQPLFIAYDPSDASLYAPSVDSQQANSASCYNIIDPTTDAVTDVTLSSAASELRDVAINPANGYAYISDPENDVVDIVNGKALVAKVSLAGDGPDGVIYSPTKKEIYVTSSSSKTVVPISSTKTVKPAITVQNAPTNGCYIPSIDQVLITYWAQTSPNAKGTLIGMNNTVAATVPLGSEATTPDGCAES